MPGSAPSTPLLDSFNRADSASLGANWSSPALSGENPCKIQGNQAKTSTSPSSSYWNTILGGAQEAYCDVAGSGQVCQLIVGLTSVGNMYRLVNDQVNNKFRLVVCNGGVDSTIQEIVGFSVPSGGKMWLYIEPSDPVGAPNMVIYCFSYAGGTWTTQIITADYSFGHIASGYIGLRLTTSGSVDNFGGGTVGVKGNAAAAPATASAVLATSARSYSGQAAPAIATASAVPATPKMNVLAAAASAVASAVTATIRSAAQAAAALATAAATAASGSSVVPTYPPIPPPTPPPPPPPPDPRDIPAIDGPFTYILYNAMLPLTWADEDLGWPMLKFFKAIAYIVHEPYAFAVDPGWELALNLDEVPSKFLDWLGQFVGVNVNDTTHMTSQQKRDTIQDAPSWRRGTRATMVEAAKRTLIGNKQVIVYERYDPGFLSVDRAYHVTFIVYQSECPDLPTTLAALLAAKPGGLQLSLLSRAGQIYQTLRDHYPPTTTRLYSTAKGDYADFEHARDVVYY